MSCKHPYLRWEAGKSKIPDIWFTPAYDETGNELKECYHNGYKYDRKTFAKPIPCRQCIGCRLDYSKDWATRIMLEAMEHDKMSNWFLTLTYDDDHVPEQEMLEYDLETGEIIGDKIGLSLLPEDMTKFLKRLREHWKRKYNVDGIRYFGCGEYGGKTQRPHYHICVMGLPIKKEQLELYKYNRIGQPIYICKEIEDIWNKGYAPIGGVSWESAAYVARYMLKKQKGPAAKDYYGRQAKIPEFTRMSRRPGLAQSYYNTNKDKIYSNDEIILPGKKARTVKPPKYYDKLFDLDNPEEYKRIKNERERKAELAAANKKKKRTLSDKEQMEHEEKIQVQKALLLKRSAEDEM